MTANMNNQTMTFTGFPSLVGELRLKIWGFAIPSARVIKVGMLLCTPLTLPSVVLSISIVPA